MTINVTEKSELAELLQFRIGQMYTVHDSNEVGIWLSNENGEARKYDHGIMMCVEIRSGQPFGDDEIGLATSVKFRTNDGEMTSAVRQPFLTRHFKKAI